MTLKSGTPEYAVRYDSVEENDRKLYSIDAEPEGTLGLTGANHGLPVILYKSVITDWSLYYHLRTD